MATNFNVGDLLESNWNSDSLFIVIFSNGIDCGLIICGDKPASYHIFSKDTCEECLKKI